MVVSLGIFVACISIYFFQEQINMGRRQSEQTVQSEQTEQTEGHAVPQLKTFTVTKILDFQAL